MLFIGFFTLIVLLTHGAEIGPVSVSLPAKEGDSVKLPTGIKITPTDRIRWFLNNNRIAQVIGNVSICTDVQCEYGDERLKGRLKLDPQTGSLTIRNLRITDSGDYKLISRTFLKIFSVNVSAVEEVPVSAIDGDLLTLHSAVEKRPDRIVWYYNDFRIAQLNGDDRKVCIDEECDKRFRHRLKIHTQTGSLTITNTTNTDSGLYELMINSLNTKKSFSVHVDPVEEMKTNAVKEGDSVALDLDIQNDHNDLLTCYFNNILIAKMTEDGLQICTDDRCKERFGHRLMVDHHTGSLTITNTTDTDSGEYKLNVTRFRNKYCIERNFIVAVMGSSQSSNAVVRHVPLISVAILFCIVVSILVLKRKRVIKTGLNVNQ